MNELSELLEVVAHGVTAILATWLGLLVLTRARRSAGAPAFSFLCFLLVAWCVAIIVQRISTDPSVIPPINLLEDAAAFLLPPATTHIAIGRVRGTSLRARQQRAGGRIWARGPGDRPGSP